jgi:hypothetical protein
MLARPKKRFDPLLRLIIFIHCDSDRGESRMPIAGRFSQRLELLDERADRFLRTLASLGGYCTVEQAERLGVASSRTRALARLQGLEEGSFLRRVADYPIVYQMTKATARLLPTDSRARRPHSIETVRSRLAGVAFYLEAIHWPAEFVFDHAEKIAAFRERGCPLEALPQRAGVPYLWDWLVLRLADGRLCVAVTDRPFASVFLQLWGLAKRFSACLERLDQGLQLVIAVADEARHRLYCRLAAHPRLQRLGQGRFKVSVTPYQLRRPVPFIRALAQPDSRFSEKSYA